MERTLVKDTLNLNGQQVKLQGWVENLRKMGKISFVDLRDKTGKVQCVGMDMFKDLTIESVIEVLGTVKQRPENMINKEQVTGTIEIEVSEYKLLNKAHGLPIPVLGEGYDINEESRLKYRYLDLRRERMQKIVTLRSKFVRELREALYNKDFTEVETPILTASTKEGSRDFVVPSRINPGKFYALPQSPQQYKQLLMTAGVEKYFQVAKCIRDENLRADRGFEFTQLDLEISFASQKEVMNTIEDVVKTAIKNLGMGDRLRDEVFPVMNYEDAMKTYGADKFDMRTEEEKKQGKLAFVWVVNFPFFKQVDKEDVSEVRDGKNGWTFTHNPFSTPIEEHLEWHLKGENIEKIITAQYDLVCNGYEVGGGSIRAHQPEVLKATYKIMGYSDEQIEESIGHMLKAFEVGTPPHGGIALGVDRLIMLLSNEQSLKETIAFPMTYNGRTAVMDGPSELEAEQLEELNISLVTKDIVQQIKELLDSKKIDYKFLEHEKTPTSEDSAKVRGTKMEEGAKAIILRNKKDSSNIMVVVPSHLKVDIKEVENFISAKFEFEKPEIILEKFGLEVGGVPPFGNLLNLKTLLDKKLLQNDKIAFNCGRPTASIIMNSKDLFELVNGEEGNWSKE